jgi:hypothetical protein
MIPGGHAQVMRGGEKISRISKGTITKENGGKMYGALMHLMCTAQDRSPQRIRKSIQMRADSLSSDQINDVYEFMVSELQPELVAMQELVTAMSSMHEGAVDADALPNGRGEFGLEETNPIPTESIFGSEAYLKRLRTLQGGMVSASRVGSTSFADVTHGMIDMYAITGEHGESLGTIFICPYHKRTSNRAPKGFKLT